MYQTLSSPLAGRGACILTTMPTRETFRMSPWSPDAAHIWAASARDTGTAPGGGTRLKIELQSITILPSNRFYLKINRLVPDSLICVGFHLRQMAHFGLREEIAQD